MSNVIVVPFFCLPEGKALAAKALGTSRKDLDEHRFAVTSVVDALAPLTRDLVAPGEPHLLEPALLEILDLAPQQSVTVAIRFDTGASRMMCTYIRSVFNGTLLE